jgi:hypothetical protein
MVSSECRWFSQSSFASKFFDNLYQFSVRLPAFDSAHRFNIEPTDEPAFAVINMNVPRRMISDEPLDAVSLRVISPID